jgi:hypothetical protein
MQARRVSRLADSKPNLAGCITFPLLIAYPRGFLTLCAHDKYTR